MSDNGSQTPIKNGFLQSDLDARGFRILNLDLELALGIPFFDDLPFLKNKADASKRLRISLTGITTGQTRVLTVPDYDGTIATLAGTEDFTNKTYNGVRLSNVGDVGGSGIEVNGEVLLGDFNASNGNVFFGGSVNVNANLIMVGAFTTNGAITLTGPANVTLPATGTLITTDQISNEPYGPDWNTDISHAPSKNAVYDKIESISTGGSGTSPFADDVAILKNLDDDTKLLRFELGGFTTGTTRILTPPDYDGKIATLDGAEAFSGKTKVELINGAHISLGDNAGFFDVRGGDDAVSNFIRFTNADFVKIINDSLVGAAVLDTSLLTQSRIFQFPDTPGTLALFSQIPIVSDVPYEVTSWNNLAATTDAPSKNAVRDKLETMYFPGSTAKVAVFDGGTGQSTYTNGQLLIGNSVGATLTKSTLTGTANQVIITNGGGSITLSLPQDIGTSSSPTFNGSNFTNLNAGQLVTGLVSQSRLVNTQSVGNSNATIALGIRDIVVTAAITAPRTYTLPTASAYPAGAVVTFVDSVRTITQPNPVTLAAASGETINGIATYVINYPGAAPVLVSDGAAGWTLRAEVGTGSSPRFYAIETSTTIGGSGTDFINFAGGIVSIYRDDAGAVANLFLTNVTGSKSYYFPNQTGGTFAVSSTDLTVDNLLVGDGARGIVDSGISTANLLLGNSPFPEAQLVYNDTDLAGGTALTLGEIYHDTLTANRTLTFYDATLGTDTPLRVKLRLTVTGGPWTLTFPTSYPVGGEGSIVSRVLQNGNHVFKWDYADGKYWLLDSFSPAVQTGDAGTGLVTLGLMSGTPTFAAANLTGTVTVAKGGTGVTTLAAHGLLIGNGTGAVVVSGAGTVGQVLTSNGASADPTFQAPAGGSGSVATDTIWATKGDLAVATANDTAAILTAGSNGQVLSADSGEATGLKWVAAGGSGSLATDTLWAAKGDVVGGTGNDTAAILSVGTNGQVLTADSTQATGLKWASAGSGSVATDTIFDTKGDLPVGTGADTAAKLTVGTNGQVLTADSAQATGTKWATPTGTYLGRQILTSGSGATYTPTSGATKLVIKIVGGGGGGGGANATTNASCGGGGGSGGYLEKIITSISSPTYTVGAGGAAGDTSPGAGGTGGNTSFVNGGTTYTASGGAGGAAVTTGTSVATADGGAGGATTGNGELNMAGGNGFYGSRSTGAIATGGSGGETIYGGGGAGRAGTGGATGDGLAGTGYGAGGGGAIAIGTNTHSGGAGKQGIIIVEEYS